MKAYAAIKPAEMTTALRAGTNFPWVRLDWTMKNLAQPKCCLLEANPVSEAAGAVYQKPLE